MEEAADQIKRIEERVQHLLKDHAVLQKENLRLEKENQRLTDKLKESSEEISNLKRKVDSLQLSTSGMNKDSKKELEKRIDIFIKEIDKCLERLHA